jgi:hypothetical protein
MLLLVALLGCDKDKDVKPEDDLWIYANRFIEEAAKRNYIFSQPNVTLKFVTEEELAPYSGYGSPDPPLVRIVQTRWEKFTNVQKEILMFHELGHAMLRRTHTNELLPSCDYKSMMLEGNQFKIYDDEHSLKREYYFDELFDRNTPYPDWGGTIGPHKTVVVSDGSTATFSAGTNPSYTGTHEEDGSLHISGAGISNTNAYWKIEVPTKDISAGSTLIAKFRMKLTNVGGDGVWADLRADYNSDIYFYTSTGLYVQNIIGTTDYTEYTLILNCYPDYRPDISFFVNLAGNSIGDIWIKDIEISYNN